MEEMNHSMQILGFPLAEWGKRGKAHADAHSKVTSCPAHSFQDLGVAQLQFIVEFGLQRAKHFRGP